MGQADALINAAAVWFALKAVEVLPLAIYDVLSAVDRRMKRNLNPDTTEETSPQELYDSRRGKLEYVVSGQGFAQYKLFRQSKRWFFISTFVPVVIFALELISIFLGNETTTCSESSDLNVVTAPGLQLFGEGEREITMIELNNEIDSSGNTFHPCFSKMSRHNGVEYIASVCSEIVGVGIAPVIKKQFLPDDKWISILIPTTMEDSLLFNLFVFSKPLRETLENATFIGAIIVRSQVLVGGKNVLHSDVVKDGTISERFRRQIQNDVKVVEESKGFTFSEYWENEENFCFEWDDTNAFNVGAPVVVNAVLAQSRSTGIRTAAEMSEKNSLGLAKSFVVSCREDFTLSRSASIAVILIALVLRILLLVVPSSVSSAEFALTISAGIVENGRGPSAFFLDVPGKTSQIE